MPKRFNFARNETQHPPCLNSVHISTHPSKKSRDASRLVTDVSPSAICQIEADKDQSDNVTASIPELMPAETHAPSFMESEASLPCNKKNAGSGHRKRRCAYLKTPNKATYEVLPHRTYHDAMPATHLANNCKSYDVSRNVKDKTSMLTRDSLEASTGTFSFGAPSVEEGDPSPYTATDAGQNPHKAGFIRHPNRTCDLNISSKLYTENAENLVQPLTHLKNANHLYTIDHLSDDMYVSTIKSTARENKPTRKITRSVVPELLSNNVEFDLKKRCLKQTNATRQKEESCSTNGIPVSQRSSPKTTWPPPPVSTREHSNGPYGVQPQRAMYTESNAQLAQMASCEHYTHPNTDTKTKPPVVIICHVPATGEALVNKPVPLKAPSRRSIIPRKLPPPPTTGFPHDDPIEAIEYQTDISPSPDDRELFHINYRTKGHTTSEAVSPTLHGAALSINMNGSATQRSEWTTHVVLNVSNKATRSRSKTRTTPVAISFGVENCHKEHITQRDADNTSVMPVSLSSPQLPWKQYHIDCITQFFTLPQDHRVTLNASTVGTYTCAWLWSALTSESLWKHALHDTRLIVQPRRFSSPLEQMRELTRYIIILVAHVTNRLERCVDRSNTSTHDLNALREKQEHGILMIVVRDVLKLWSLAVMAYLKDQHRNYPVTPTNEHKMHISCNLASVAETLNIKKETINKLMSACRYLEDISTSIKSRHPIYTTNSFTFFKSFLKSLQRSHSTIVSVASVSEPLLKTRRQIELSQAKDQLLLQLRQEQEKRREFQNSLLENRLQNWIAVLTLCTLKSLNLYVNIRRRLRGYVGSDVSRRCSQCGSFSSIPKETADTSGAKENHTMGTLNGARYTVPGLCSRCGLVTTLEPEIHSMRPSFFGSSLDEMTCDSGARASAVRSSIGRFSLLSYGTLDDGVQVNIEQSDFDKCLSTPQRTLFDPMARTTHTRNDSVLSIGASYSSLRSSQRRRRRTTLGYTLRLQKPK